MLPIAMDCWRKRNWHAAAGVPQDLPLLTIARVLDADLPGERQQACRAGADANTVSQTCLRGETGRFWTKHASKPDVAGSSPIPRS